MLHEDDRRVLERLTGRRSMRPAVGAPCPDRPSLREGVGHEYRGGGRAEGSVSVGGVVSVRGRADRLDGLVLVDEHRPGAKWTITDDKAEE